MVHLALLIPIKPYNTHVRYINQRETDYPKLTQKLSWLSEDLNVERLHFSSTH